MYKNTTYKAFIAKTAAQLMAEMIPMKAVWDEQIALSKGFSENKVHYDRMVNNAIGAAAMLAERLEEWWRSEGDRETVFFDTEDTLNTGIENGLDRIVEQLDKLNDNVSILR